MRLLEGAQKSQSLLQRKGCALQWNLTIKSYNLYKIHFCDAGPTQDATLTFCAELHYKTPDSAESDNTRKSRKREFCTCPQILNDARSGSKSSQGVQDQCLSSTRFMILSEMFGSPRWWLR